MKSLLFPAVILTAAIQAQAALIAGYNFNETSGTSAADAIRGTTGNATMAGTGTTFVAGKIGNAANFNGSGWFDVLNPVVNGQTQLSISAWVNITTNTTWGTIVNDWATTPTFHFGLNSSSGQFSNYLGGSVSGNVVNPGVATTGIWYNVAFTFDDTTHTQILYVNGTQVATSSAVVANVLANGGGSMRIAASTAGNELLNGKIDDLAFYNNVLTPSDITTIYNNGLAGISAVPEPSVALLGGFGMLGLLRRRR